MSCLQRVFWFSSFFVLIHFSIVPFLLPSGFVVPNGTIEKLVFPLVPYTHSKHWTYGFSLNTKFNFQTTETQTHPIQPGWASAGISWRRCWRRGPRGDRGGILPEPSSKQWPAATSVRRDPDPRTPSPPHPPSAATPRSCPAGSWGGGRAVLLRVANAHR